MRDRDQQRGYTLLEVVVAFAILTLSLSTLIPGLATLTGQSGTARETLAATEFARSLIEPIGIAEPLRPGVREGRVGDAWRWRIGIEPYRDEGGPVGAGLYSIVVEVTAGGRELTRLQTIRAAGDNR